ncbi:DUF2627 domain-containing protein [Aquibacillus koreensis]|uniref:DUF2627 domain-containing protein n=1 Tax=Aquibacillus koreensis TaxID=279446 RepID=A0A9X3WKA1_9BACI|nr:DUF2627 domain-containing protein [Aquibacillus koreensis]MCT2537503.1 DUF2627 domain-containing protein [Aquibacillus koreensis]MDC3418949.1 DUF2627 domain-containing protein [Aquibacillus koreensis]
MINLRLIALLLLVIPGVIATFGIKLMRDALFGVFFPIFFHSTVQFIVGLLFFIAGLAFIAGFILHRDRKRNLTKGRFSKEEES